MRHKLPFASVLCTGLMLLATLLALPSVAYADKATTSLEYHNGDDGLRTATDLHFTFSIPEDEKDDYYIESWSVTTTPPIGGTRTDTPEDNAHGHTWKVGIQYDSISVPYCTTIQVDIEAEIKGEGWHYDYNTISIHDERWTYATGEDRRIMPDHDFHFPTSGAVWSDELHNTVYTIENRDATESLTVNYLHFYHDSYFLSFWDQWNELPGGRTPIAEINTPFTLNPGEFRDVQLSGIPNSPANYIYMVGEVEYQMPGSLSEVREFRQSHEEEDVPSYPVLTHWGIVVMVMLLLAAGIVLTLRRRGRLASQA